MLVGELVDRSRRLHVRKLGAHGQNHENGTDRTGVFRGERGGVSVASIELIKQPVLFNVKVVSLSIFEKDLDEKLRHISWRETGDGSRDQRRAGLQLSGTPVVFKCFSFSGSLRILAVHKSTMKRINTSGAAALIHSSIFFRIFMEKFRYENSPEYSAPVVSHHVSRTRTRTRTKTTYESYYPA